MSSYVDTSIVVSNLLEKEKNHEIARRAVLRAKELGELYVSTFVLTELWCTLRRRIREVKFPPGFAKLNDHVKVEVAVRMALHKLDPRIIPDAPQLAPMQGHGIDAFQKYTEAIRISLEIPLPTGDSLNLAYAAEFAKKYGVKNFVTLDGHFTKTPKRRAVKRVLGLNILP